MRTQSKNFSFTLPYTKSKKINGALKSIHLFDLEIEGVAEYDPTVSTLEPGRYSVEIDCVRFQGQDIKPVLDEFNVDLGKLYEASEEHASGLFDNNSIAA